MPPLVIGFPGFLIGAGLPIAISYVLLRSQIAILKEERLADEERRAAEAQAYVDRRATAKEAANRWPSEQLGATHISQGRLMHVKGQPKCFFMLTDEGKAIRIVEFKDAPDFELQGECTLPTSRIISIHIASPTVTKTRSKTVPVTVVEKKNKSPVGRGLVGGVLLGPAGVVLGAASGLNSKVVSTVKHETVNENYDALGDPQLIIGTSNPDQPIFKIKFDPPTLADEWIYRIQGIQRR
jgi:hypothetical protein